MDAARDVGTLLLDRHHQVKRLVVETLPKPGRLLYVIHFLLHHPLGTLFFIKVLDIRALVKATVQLTTVLSQSLLTY